VDVQLKECKPPKVLYHGTAEKSVDSIEKSGLKPMSRLYVHLSKDIDTAIKVGSRHGKIVVYEVDTEKMTADGYKFFISDNGVWLTKIVPVEYLSKIELNN
jgi:putative RNA 2'-phosphotransferase